MARSATSLCHPWIKLQIQSNEFILFAPVSKPVLFPRSHLKLGNICVASRNFRYSTYSKYFHSSTRRSSELWKFQFQPYMLTQPQPKFPNFRPFGRFVFAPVVFECPQHRQVVVSTEVQKKKMPHNSNSVYHTIRSLLTGVYVGHEFNEADTLTTSEAKLLIDAVLTQRPKDTGEDMPLTEYSFKVVEV